MALLVRNLTFSSRDPGRLADFWAAALGYPERHVAPDGMLVAPAGWGFPRLTFQHVGDPQPAPGPVHLDLTADDMEAEIARLIGLGATRHETVDATQSGTVTWTVMRDPDGNELCVVRRPADERPA
jgi:hypothetical protein